MNLVGLAAADIIRLNERLVGAGRCGDLEGVQAAAARPFHTFEGQWLIGPLWEKAAVLMHGLMTTQYFQDGNKRTAWAAAEAFLALNGEDLDDIDDDEAEAFALSIAAHEIGADEIADWLYRHAAPLQTALDDEGTCQFCGLAGRLPGAELLPREHVRRGANDPAGNAEFSSVASTDEPTEMLASNFVLHRDLVPGVCGPCRDGWMKLIDRYGYKPWMKPFTLQRSEDKHRRSMAAWAIKTALLRTLLGSKLPGEALQMHSRRLRETARPPIGWSVWLLRAEPVHDLTTGRLTSTSVGEADDLPELIALQWTFQFDELLLVVLYERSQSWRSTSDVFSTMVSSGRAACLWPGTGAVDPPSDVLDRAEAEETGNLLNSQSEAMLDDDQSSP